MKKIHRRVVRFWVITVLSIALWVLGVFELTQRASDSFMQIVVVVGVVMTAISITGLAVLYTDYELTPLEEMSPEEFIHAYFSGEIEGNG